MLGGAGAMAVGWLVEVNFAWNPTAGCDLLARHLSSSNKMGGKTILDMEK
jgi:hypothetical protein